MFIIGIDVGKKGGISVLEYTQNECKLKWCYAYDDEKLIAMVKLLDCDKTVAYVEDVHAMPNQGTVSMFNFGKSLGYILGVLESNYIDVEMVRPQEWKKMCNLIGKDKKHSISKAKEMFSGVNLYPTKRSRTESDGMAESLLIAYFGYLNEEAK